MSILNAINIVFNTQIVNQPVNGYEVMKLGDDFYKPILEVIDYLQDNDFI